MAVGGLSLHMKVTAIIARLSSLQSCNEAIGEMSVRCDSCTGAATFLGNSTACSQRLDQWIFRDFRTGFLCVHQPRTSKLRFSLFCGSANCAFGVLSRRKPQKYDSRAFCSAVTLGFLQLASGSRISSFCAANLKNTIPAHSFDWSIGFPATCKRQIAFVVFEAAGNLKIRFPPLLQRGVFGASSSRKTKNIRFPPLLRYQRVSRDFRTGVMFFVCLALDNLKSTIPAILCGTGALGFPPLASGNRRFGVLNCRKPQKYDSRPFCKAAIVPVVFLGRKPQNYDSRPLLYAGLESCVWWVQLPKASNTIPGWGSWELHRR